MTDAIQPFGAPFTQHRETALADAARLAGISGKLNAGQIQGLYDKALQTSSIDDRDMWATAIGYAFGDLIAERGKFEWALAFDEFGREPVLLAPGSKFFCAPIYMVGRRLEQREAANIDRLCNDTIQTIRDAVKKDGGAR